MRKAPLRRNGFRRARIADRRCGPLYRRQRSDASTLRRRGPGAADGPHHRRLSGLFGRRRADDSPGEDPPFSGAHAQADWTHSGGPRSRAGPLVGDLVRQTEERLDRERELLDRLRTIAASRPADWQEAVRIVKLVRGLGSTSASRRQQAVLSWPADVAPPVDLLVRAVLSESDPNVAGALQWALARSDGDVVAGLRTGAQSDDVDIRRRAILAIAAMPEAPGADVVLVRALGDSDVSARKHAALALGRLGEATSLPALVDVVADGVSDVEATDALESLSRIPACARAVEAAVAGKMKDLAVDSAARERLAEALASCVGPGTVDHGDV